MCMTLTLSNKWISQFFSVACSPQRMVETYQYLPVSQVTKITERETLFSFKQSVP